MAGAGRRRQAADASMEPAGGYRDTDALLPGSLLADRHLFLWASICHLRDSTVTTEIRDLFERNNRLIAATSIICFAFGLALSHLIEPGGPAT
jgi:hypothetical protein